MLHFIMLWLGLTNASGPQYLFWSGFFGDVTIFIAAVLFAYKHTCHQTGCLRFTKHSYAGTPWCTKHHPELS